MDTSTFITPADLLNPQNGLTRAQAEALVPKLNAQAADPLLIIKSEEISPLPLSAAPLVSPEQMSDEALASFVADTFTKIADAIPFIRELRQRFETKSPQWLDEVGIMGCSTWTEFCEKVLKRTPRAIQLALKAATTPSPIPEAPEQESAPITDGGSTPSLQSFLKDSVADLIRDKLDADFKHLLAKLPFELKKYVRIKRESPDNGMCSVTVLPLTFNQLERIIGALAARDFYGFDVIHSEPEPPSPEPATPCPAVMQYLPEVFSKDDADRLFQGLSSLPWQQHMIPMYGKKIPAPRLYQWMGVPLRLYGEEIKPIDWTPDALEIRDRVHKETGFLFNSLNINFYRDEKDHLGWHVDKQNEGSWEFPIVSLSLGAERDFQIQRYEIINRRKRNPVGEIYTTRLAHGSLIVMPAQMQASWTHRIKQQTAQSGPRINLTFRMMPEPQSSAPEPSQKLRVGDFFLHHGTLRQITVVGLEAVVMSYWHKTRKYWSTNCPVGDLSWLEGTALTIAEVERDFPGALDSPPVALTQPASATEPGE
jgi:alkylated DNA repair dioxygenase AlkB